MAAVERQLAKLRTDQLGSVAEIAKKSSDPFLDGAPSIEHRCTLRAIRHVVHCIVGTAPDQGRGYCVRKQTRTNGLGHDDKRRTLQRASRFGGVNEIAPAIRHDVHS